MEIKDKLIKAYEENIELRKVIQGLQERVVNLNHVIKIHQENCEETFNQLQEAEKQVKEYKGYCNEYREELSEYINMITDLADGGTLEVREITKVE